MRFFRFLFFFLIFFLVNFTNAKSKLIVPFPYMIEPMDAKASGMGNTGTGMANDIYATFWNPAGLGFLQVTELSDFIKNDKSIISKTIYFEGALSSSEALSYSNNNLFYLNVSAGIYLKPLGGTIAIDLTTHSYGEFDRVEVDGRISGKYLAGNALFGIAYGVNFGENWGVGAKFKYLGIHISPKPTYSPSNGGNGNSYAFDFGCIKKFNFDNTLNSDLTNKTLSVGINLQNIGPKIDFNESEPIPSTLRFGVGYKTTYNSIHDFTLALDVAKLLVKTDSLGSDPLPKSLFSSWSGSQAVSIGTGVEYWYNRLVAVRAGYYYESDEMGNRNFLTLGTSLRVSIIEADFSYYNYSGNSQFLTNRLKCTIRIGG